ncbi:MAG: hypothetical protein M0R17_09415 [Candidatus Omnitrophica bacterium]|jgi:membrane-bound ClpP family serine protease|nr:hypothetical protein [Candidatus Omnitrophota bacterium]
MKNKRKINLGGIIMILIGLVFLVVPFYYVKDTLTIERVISFIAGLILYGGGWRILKD